MLIWWHGEEWCPWPNDFSMVHRTAQCGPRCVEMRLTPKDADGVIALLVKEGALRYEAEDRGGPPENWMQRVVGPWVKEVKP
jgi:hypothetical protein